MINIKNLLLKILCSDLFSLVIFLIKLWYLVIFLTNISPYSKLHYFFDTDEEFLNDFNIYHNQSHNAIKQLKQWKELNYKNADLNSYFDPFFNHENFVRNRKNFLLANDVICVGIMSKERLASNNHNYPLKTVVSLISRIPLKYQDRILIELYNVDDIPFSDRSDLTDLLNIVKMVDLKQRVSDSIEKFSHLRKIKESADYITVLRKYSKQDFCDYVLLIEDDSIACHNWYDKIIDAVVELKNTNWYCLKLFTSFREYDWLTYPYGVFIFVLKVFFTMYIFIKLFKFFLVFKNQCVKKFLKMRKTLHLTKFILFVLILNSFLVHVRFNEVSVNPIGYGVKEYSIGFNAIANLYPKDKLIMIADFLEKNIMDFVNGKTDSFEPKDLALDLIGKVLDYKEFTLEPSVFQHTGLQSSLGGPTNYEGVRFNQLRPFQSYSFIKEYKKDILFDPEFWLS
ncbi:unnamed protein product [Brachionus calyciflorus]|uniref:Uncharacterized protein n=1 Tax=Brachionus calyciflorus TaxID=104777 RepID=A0A813R566_9BILA|nr:unnamed protein product [Brachionus calyciflorus]